MKVSKDTRRTGLYFNTYDVFSDSGNYRIGAIEVHDRQVKSTYYVAWIFKKNYSMYGEGRTKDCKSWNEAIKYIHDNNEFNDKTIQSCDVNSQEVLEQVKNHEEVMKDNLHYTDLRIQAIVDRIVEHADCYLNDIDSALCDYWADQSWSGDRICDTTPISCEDCKGYNKVTGGCSWGWNK